MENVEIARLFNEMADLLDLQDANPFRVRAWRDAARFLLGYAEPLKNKVEAGEDLTPLPRIGKDLAHAIEQLVRTGTFDAIEAARRGVPPDMARLMRVAGVGPKRARRLWKELGAHTIEDVEQAAESGRIAALPGFGEKLQRQIHHGLLELEKQPSERRFAIDEVDEHVAALTAWLRGAPKLRRLDVAGSYRRRRATVGDLDIVASAPEGRPVTEHLAAWDRVDHVVALGDTRATVVLRDGLQVDLRVVEPDCYGAALQYLTGSKDHGVALRRRALERHLRLSEYGVFRFEGGVQGERVAGRTEEEVYAAVDLPWIPPELREARGEIEAAARGELSRLVALDDVRGDLHVHTTWSHGRETPEAMIEACLKLGYEYVAFSEHGPSLPGTRGLDARKARERWNALQDLGARFPKLRLLRSMEVDILRDGSLDATDEVLSALDVVVVALHTDTDLPPAQQTKRILKALEHPRAHILAHPLARRAGGRPPVRVDLDDILHACRERGVAVEHDCQAGRSDLDDVHLKRARDLGLKVVISTGAHATSDLARMRHGIDQARRAWLRSTDVLNTLPADAFLRALRR